MFYGEIRPNEDLSYVSICSLSILYNSKFHYNGNVCGNKCCHYNEGSLYSSTVNICVKDHFSFDIAHLTVRKYVKTWINLHICTDWSVSLLKDALGPLLHTETPTNTLIRLGRWAGWSLLGGIFLHWWTCPLLIITSSVLFLAVLHWEFQVVACFAWPYMFRYITTACFM